MHCAGSKLLQYSILVVSLYNNIAAVVFKSYSNLKQNQNPFINRKANAIILVKAKIGSAVDGNSNPQWNGRSRTHARTHARTHKHTQHTQHTQHTHAHANTHHVQIKIFLQRCLFSICNAC